MSWPSWKRRVPRMGWMRQPKGELKRPGEGLMKAPAKGRAEPAGEGFDKVPVEPRRAALPASAVVTAGDVRRTRILQLIEGLLDLVLAGQGLVLDLLP